MRTLTPTYYKITRGELRDIVEQAISDYDASEPETRITYPFEDLNEQQKADLRRVANTAHAVAFGATKIDGIGCLTTQAFHDNVAPCLQFDRAAKKHVNADNFYGILQVA